MKALIFQEKVVQVEETEFEVASPLFWVDCPNDCTVGWSYINEELIPIEEDAKTTQEYVQEYMVALREIIDSTATTKHYDDAAACATYANSTNLTWKAEADAFIAWRDSCWSYLIDTQTQIENEEIEPPSIQDFITNIPSFNWE